MSREGFELLFDAYPDDRDVQLLRDAVQEAITTDLTELRFYLTRLTSKDGCADAVVGGMERVIRDLQMPALHDVPAGAIIKVVVIRHELASAGAAYCRQGKEYRWTGWWWCKEPSDGQRTAGVL